MFELKATSAPHVLRFWNFLLCHVFEKYADLIDVTAFSVYKNMTSEWTKHFSLISCANNKPLEPQNHNSPPPKKKSKKSNVKVKIWKKADRKPFYKFGIFEAYSTY